jgi:hypothetical protein
MNVRRSSVDGSEVGQVFDLPFLLGRRVEDHALLSNGSIKFPGERRRFPARSESV